MSKKALTHAEIEVVKSEHLAAYREVHGTVNEPEVTYRKGFFYVGVKGVAFSTPYRKHQIETMTATLRLGGRRLPRVFGGLD